MTAPLPTTQSVSHIAFTVRDMEASADWYQRVFGWSVLRRFGHGEAGSPRVLLFDARTWFVVALCQPEDATGDAFDYRRTGLDHVGFLVGDQAELDQWIAHLDDLGVAHSPIRVLDLGRFISFEDPDGIQLELWVDARQRSGQS